MQLAKVICIDGTVRLLTNQTIKKLSYDNVAPEDEQEDLYKSYNTIVILFN